MPSAQCQCVGESFGAVIGSADGAHLPLLYQLRVSLQRLIQRGVGIVTMRLIKIDVARLQPPRTRARALFHVLQLLPD